MDIREALLEEHSKAQTIRIADYIGSDPKRFKELMQLFMHDEWLLTQRSAWVVGHCAERNPAMIQPFLGPLLKHLKKEKIHDAVKRNSTKILSNLAIPKKHQGMAATICFDFLANPQEAVAIKVFSMQVLYNICEEEPDLADELRLLIEDQMELGSAGFRSRGRKILKALAKLQASS